MTDSLSPDQRWEQYKTSGGLQPHDHMSPETRDAIKEMKDMFEKVVSELKEEHIAPIREDVKGIKIELKNKVSFKIFTWVLSILMAIVVGWMGLIWTSLQQLTEKTILVNNNISLIQYRLDHFEVVK